MLVALFTIFVAYQYNAKYVSSMITFTTQSGLYTKFFKIFERIN